MKTINFLLVGVGGQGVLMASNILASVGMMAGYEVKKSEIHGMSQRGGNVSSHVRWGEAVFSPIIPDSETDFLLAFEAMEALRYLPMLKRESVLLVDRHRIVPVTVTGGSAEYPAYEAIETVLRQVSDNFRWVDGGNMAATMGNSRVANIITLGLLSTYLNVADDIWKEAITRRVPQKFTELNFRAWEAGRALRRESSAVLMPAS